MSITTNDGRALLNFVGFNNLKASKNRMNSIFTDASELPLDTISFNVNSMNINSPERSLELLDVACAVTEVFESHPHSSSIDFEEIGCEWKLSLSINEKSGQTGSYENRNEQDKYWMHGIVIEGGNEIDITYSVHLCLMVPTKTTPMFLKMFQNSNKTRKIALNRFEDICYKVQKQLSRLEFPSFPEGSSGKSFRSCYQLNKQIYEGMYTVVFKGRHRKTGKVVVIKSVVSNKLSAREDAAIFTEVALMANMDHPHIIKLIDFFEDEKRYIMVLEYLEGGDLLKRIGSKKVYSENDARKCCKILLDTIYYCHSNSVAHLDLKAENLVLTCNEDDVTMKLIDFGLAQRVFGPNCLTRGCGTPHFVAPEIIRKEPFDERADMWSVGVIIYLLLSSSLPFTGENDKEIFPKIVKGKFNFESSNWDYVSQEAKDLVLKLLDMNPDSRWTAERALSCSWFKQSSNVLMNNYSPESANYLSPYNSKLLSAHVHLVS